MSKDTNQLMGHAEDNDGIEEYDNPLPDWWLGLFWFTIVWALGYTVHYHFIADRSQEKALAAEMAAADERWPEQASSAMAFEFSESAAESGVTVYNQNCIACHGPEMEGGIGPSLVDDEWIHGGQASDILGIVRNGVAEKGMVAWEGILSPEQINQVTAYVIQRNSAATGRPIDDIVASPDSAPDGDGEASPSMSSSGD